uniref:Uncharacterized protein n=1 Tax=Rhizophagus irregularis (strain DAOM 181602 / DAOM 197198 / MUCL 43194) TaxID=747089 RepID=U9UIR3_RHIID
MSEIEYNISLTKAITKGKNEAELCKSVKQMMEVNRLLLRLLKDRVYAEKEPKNKKARVLRQALINNAEAYAKAQEEVLSIPGTSVIEDIQYAMSLLYEQYKAEEWPDMFKAKYDLSCAESPTKEALVAARFLEEHSNIAAVLYQQHNYDYDWILNESSRILSNAIGEEYDDDFMKENDNLEEYEDEFDIIENEKVDGKTFKQDFQDYSINGEDFVECEESYGSDFRSVKG